MCLQELMQQLQKPSLTSCEIADLLEAYLQKGMDEEGCYAICGTLRCLVNPIWRDTVYILIDFLMGRGCSAYFALDTVIQYLRYARHSQLAQAANDFPAEIKN